MSGMHEYLKPKFEAGLTENGRLKKANSELAAPPCSVVLPPVDGYYWMKNLSGVNNDVVVWRIVDVYDRPDRGTPTRIARDGTGAHTARDLSVWTGVEFHGPISPPSTLP